MCDDHNDLLIHAASHFQRLVIRMPRTLSLQLGSQIIFLSSRHWWDGVRRIDEEVVAAITGIQ